MIDASLETLRLRVCAGLLLGRLEKGDAVGFGDLPAQLAVFAMAGDLILAERNDAVGRDALRFDELSVSGVALERDFKNKPAAEGQSIFEMAREVGAGRKSLLHYARRARGRAVAVVADNH